MTPQTESDAKSYVIVTGSSAGGIDALIALVAGLPETFDAPIVIAQHLAPGHASRLAHILCGRSKLDVRTIAETEPLQAGSVYLVGPDRDVEITDGSAHVVAVERKGPKPSIDRLFATAAEAYGERLIAIIFSGMGSDGLAGARVVKAHGGTVIVQEPSSAPFPAMPLAIPPTLIDLAARPEDMAATLVDFLRTSRLPQSAGNRATLLQLLERIRERSGIDFSQYKTPTLMRRLARLMVGAKTETIEDYLSYLETHPREYQRLVNAFLIKVTEFFRDAAFFEHLRVRILPELLAQAPNFNHELRIWSAGASTGEEAYSLAIICAELLRERGDSVGVRIFATDLDETAIAFARRGIYAKELLHDLPDAWLERYFVRVGDAYEVGKLIRNMTVFGKHDLAKRPPFPRIDLCLCRNVLIYFTKDLQARALRLFAFSLRDGGYLALGRAESPGALTDYFKVDDASLHIFRRRGERILVPAPRPGGLSSEERTSSDEPRREAAAPERNRNVRSANAETIGSLIAASTIGIVLVDRRYTIVSINTAARALLEIHGVGVGEDLIHLVRTIDSNELRTLVDTAFRNEPSTAREISVREPSGEIEKWLQMSATLDRTPHAGWETVGLFVVDVTQNVVRRDELERRTSEQSERIRDLTANAETLVQRQRGLLQANDELIQANADLRNANEQLQIAAEEAASGSEEIETLNEEMQATNEELETLNEELQATVEELNTTNDELEARGADLEEQAKDRERAAGFGGEREAAIARAFETFVGPYVILIGDRDVVYASEALGGRDAVARFSPDWYREMVVQVEGKRYVPWVHRMEDGAFTMVALKEMSSTAEARLSK